MREMPKTTRTSYSGVIDADGHINEPHDLWERYIDPPFRDRAIRMGTDPDGSERLQVGGRPSRYLNAELLARGRGMGSTFEERNNMREEIIKEAAFRGSDDDLRQMTTDDEEVDEEDGWSGTQESGSEMKLASWLLYQF